MNPQVLELLNRLLEATDRLQAAVEQKKDGMIEEAVSKRQLLIDELSAFLPLNLEEPKIRTLAGDILSKDRTVSTAMKDYYESLKNDVVGSDKKIEGMKRYFSSGYDLAAGQLIDRKR